jgi:hypothetical protein
VRSARLAAAGSTARNPLASKEEVDMTGRYRKPYRQLAGVTATLCGIIFLAACAHAPAKGVTAPSGTTKAATVEPVRPEPVIGPAPAVAPARISEIEDLRRIPQRLQKLAEQAGTDLELGEARRAELLQEYLRHFFRPWTSPTPIFDPADSAYFMKRQAQGEWYGVNKRKVPRKKLQELVANCDLRRFPSRNDRAIAVAPGHLRGLPTPLPFYEKQNDEPFDMLSYPQVKLNEPLRVLHQSADGAWLFVETAYSNGWLQSRDVALVDHAFIKKWMAAPHLVIVRDLAPVSDGKGVGTFQAKLGTVLPLAEQSDDEWEVLVASAGEKGIAETHHSDIPRAAAAPFPLPFDAKNIALIGDQLLGEPYGWGEMYDLRDCSALLRDFFLPFGIWLPRTAADQIASVRHREDLAALDPIEREERIKDRGIPFLSLLFKPGHIMLYVGEDRDGRALVFHDAWSIRVKDGAGERKQIIGEASITTLEPGKELGLVETSSLLERVTEMATLTNRFSGGNGTGSAPVTKR